MILSDRDVLTAMDAGVVRVHLGGQSLLNIYLSHRLIIKPFEPSNLQPSSVDLTLANSFMALSWPEPLSMSDGNGLCIMPGDFILSCTEEWLEIPDELIAHLDGKSSYGRRGLLIHATAGYVDPGWKGRLTLEIHNVSKDTVILYPRKPICQVRFELLTSPAMRPYGSEGLGSHYQWSTGPRV